MERSEPDAPFLALDPGSLPPGGHVREFQGQLHGGARVSFIWVDMPPGAGVRLHRHAYEEVFIIQEGRATFTVGSSTLDVRAPLVLVVRPGVPHAFVNSGDGPLRQVDIHASDRFVTEWLED